MQGHLLPLLKRVCGNSGVTVDSPLGGLGTSGKLFNPSRSQSVRRICKMQKRLGVTWGWERIKAVATLKAECLPSVTSQRLF